jgi:hypothetical protein
VIVNGGKLVVAAPSLTLIVMLAKVPAAVGVPWIRPVLVANVAQAGRFVIENVNASLFGSLAVGVKEYIVPTCAAVGGEPEIVGGEFEGGGGVGGGGCGDGGGAPAVTVTVNGGKLAVAVPSLTLIVTLVAVPAVVGMPCRRPVVVLKTAQAGGLTIANVSASPFASLALGMKVYIELTCAVSGGVPVIVGAAFADGVVAAVLCVAAPSPPPPHAAVNPAMRIKIVSRDVRSALVMHVLPEDSALHRRVTESREPEGLGAEPRRLAQMTQTPNVAASNPAVVANGTLEDSAHQTGGFASPPRDGFALISSFLRTELWRRLVGPNIVPADAHTARRGFGGVASQKAANGVFADGDAVAGKLARPCRRAATNEDEQM